jgi:hypothetical protein
MTPHGAEALTCDLVSFITGGRTASTVPLSLEGNGS